MSVHPVKAASTGSYKLNQPAECNREELHQVVHRYAKSVHMRFVPNELNCDHGWAVLGGDLEDPHAPVGGPQGVGTTLIFRKEGKEWKHQDASSVCGTLNPEKPETRPKDAKIPGSLYFLGCLVG